MGEVTLLLLPDYNMKSYEVIESFVRLGMLWQTGRVIELSKKEADKYKESIKEIKSKITKPYKGYKTK